METDPEHCGHHTCPASDRAADLACSSSSGAKQQKQERQHGMRHDTLQLYGTNTNEERMNHVVWAGRGVGRAQRQHRVEERLQCSRSSSGAQFIGCTKPHPSVLCFLRRSAVAKKHHNTRTRMRNTRPLVVGHHTSRSMLLSALQLRRHALGGRCWCSATVVSVHGPGHTAVLLGQRGVQMRRRERQVFTGDFQMGS